jgi:fumarylacetoacetase
MSTAIAANDPSLKSWVESANDDNCDFPIQNLPFGRFSTAHRDISAGVAIGNQILDLKVVEDEGLLPESKGTFTTSSLNDFMALGNSTWSATRQEISNLLSTNDTRIRDNPSLRNKALVAMEDAELHLPFQVAEYTDFYSSLDHAINCGKLFLDAENPLFPNWRHIPVGYNGRASTVVVSGSKVRRPMGQINPQMADKPTFSPCEKLDLELEMGAIVGTPSEMGSSVSVSEANEMIFGFVLLNDWSARDIQFWEGQPLGPFQSKAFATTISPWVVMREALEPFRVEGPKQEPAPLPYLAQSAPNNFDINLEVHLQAEGQTDTTIITRTNYKYMYWSSAQQLAHHSSSGCAMRSGDLLGSGTVSGPRRDSLGCLLELTEIGRIPFTIANGAERTFLEDGDSLTLEGWCQGDGYRIGFGKAEGTIIGANGREGIVKE